MIDLATLLSSVGVVRKIATELMGLAGEFRGGLFGNQKSNELKAKLEDLDKRLRDIGRVATVARAYRATHQNVLETLQLTRRAEQHLRDGIDDLRGPDNSARRGAWRLVETQFDAIESSRDASIKVLYERQEWYDAQDHHQLDGLLNDSTLAFERARTSVRNHFPDDLLYHVRDMSEKLQRAETLLRSTLDDKILGTLIGLGA